MSKNKRLKLYPAGRKCEICGHELARSNSGQKCFRHEYSYEPEVGNRSICSSPKNRGVATMNASCGTW